MTVNILKSIGEGILKTEQDEAMGFLLHALSTYDKDEKQHLANLLNTSDRIVKRNEIISYVKKQEIFSPKKEDASWLNQHLNGSSNPKENKNGFDILKDIEQNLMQYIQLCQRKETIPIRENGLFLLYWSRYLTRYFKIEIPHENLLKQIIKQSYRFRNEKKDWEVSSELLKSLYCDFLNQHRTFLKQLEEQDFGECKTEESTISDNEEELPTRKSNEISLRDVLLEGFECEINEEGLEVLIQDSSIQMNLKELKKRLFIVAKWNGIDWSNKERVGNFFQLHESDMKYLFDKTKENESILKLQHFDLEKYQQYVRKMILEMEDALD